MYLGQANRHAKQQNGRVIVLFIQTTKQGCVGNPRDTYAVDGYILYVICLFILKYIYFGYRI